MAKRYTNTFFTEVMSYVTKLNTPVILRADLNFLGESRQVSRAIKALIEEGKLIKIGYGIYVKAKRTPYSEKPVMEITLPEACAQAFERLNIQWEPGNAIKEYNEGRTQQVPAQYVMRLKDRYRGRIGYGKQQILFEDQINAR